MAGVLNKLKGMVGGGHHEEDRGRTSPHSPLNPAASSEGARSQSRGRNLVATGRGGAGNMSRSRVREGSELDNPLEVEEARSRSRSRARRQNHGEDLPIASGRGGLGNVAGHGKNNGEAIKMKERELDLEEERVEKDFERKHLNDEYLAGRGGMGNAKHHGHAGAH